MSKMALKLLFFLLQNHKNCPAARGYALRPPSTVTTFLHRLFGDYAPPVTSLSCIRFFSTRPKSDKLCAKKNNFCFNPLSKILAACLVTFTAVDMFFRRLWSAEETSYIRKAAGLILFLNMNAKF